MQALGLSDVVGRPMRGVARIALEHWRCQVFRPIAILEYAVLFICLICLLPLILLAALFSETDLELPSIKTRFYRRWHQLRVILLDPGGQVLSVADSVPATEELGYAAVASVLDAAQREQVVVVESIVDGGAREVMEVWYGGRPLLAHPEEVNEERAASLLRTHALRLESERDVLSIIEESAPLARGQRIWGWLLLPLILPLVPFLLLSPASRRSLRHAWADLRGSAERSRTVVQVRAESIATFRERGSERWDEHVIDGSDLLGITFSPTLGYDANVTRYPASLRLIGRRHSTALPLSRARGAERALGDLLVAATLRLRSARPELGLLGPGPRPTRCPFCAALYLMEPGSRCPSCGAYAGTTP